MQENQVDGQINSKSYHSSSHQEKKYSQTLYNNLTLGDA